MPYPTTGNQPLFVVVLRTLAFVKPSLADGWTPPPNASALTAAYLHRNTTTRTTHVPWMWWLCAKPATSLGIAEATTDVDHSLVPRSFAQPVSYTLALVPSAGVFDVQARQRCV